MVSSSNIVPLSYALTLRVKSSLILKVFFYFFHFFLYSMNVNYAKVIKILKLKSY